jgi:hypothetical protein
MSPLKDGILYLANVKISNMNYDLFVIKEIVINREIVKHCIHNSN